MKLGDSWKLFVDESGPEKRESWGGTVYDIAFVRSLQTRLDLALGAKRSGATGVAVSVVVSSDGSTLSDEDGVP
jgi:hypothetical protein